MRKNTFFRSKRIVAAATACAVAAIFFIINQPAVVGVSATVRELPIYSVQRDNRAVSLTFDAAWGNEDAQRLIDILGKYDIKATFFVVGEWAERFPESVKALSDAGHEIMNHSDNHAHISRLSTAQIAENITACNEKIAAITGVTPTLFRAPYGEYDDNVIKAVKSLGMFTIQWDVDSLDWRDLGAGDITKRVSEKVAPGSIVQFHISAPHTLEALPAIIEFLLQNRYKVVPVSELLLRGEYIIDHTGRQCPSYTVS